jgi:hypothetical protein
VLPRRIPTRSGLVGRLYERRERISIYKNEVRFGEGGKEFMKHKILELIQVLMFYLYTKIT